jgi:hypothetical protein
MTTKTPIGFDAFFQAYIDCALWASTEIDEDGNDLGNLDDYSIDDIDPESLAKLRETALDFFEDNEELIGLNYEQAGHDFWLTRNGHGAGFWDRGDLYGTTEDGEDIGQLLTKASKVYGSCDLWVNLSEDDEPTIYASE